jgi:16S rRNA processing protein RimM
VTEYPEAPVVIGKVTGVFGVRGWVKVYAYTESLESFLAYRRCLLRREGRWQPAEIVQARRHGKGLVAQFAEIEDRDQAQLLTGSEIAIRAEQLPELPPGEYYWHQLEGLRVLAGETLLGEVDHLMATGANDVLVVRPCAGSLDQRERLIPWVPELYVLAVDTEAGVIRVDWDPDF